MISLKRLKQSKAARNAAASYFAFFSIAASAFLSIPIAVFYLSPDQIGLWAVVNQIVSYLLWMDLGIGGATGRKMADAVARRDHQEINRWWSASQCVLTFQAMLVAVLGVTLMPYTLALFKIPQALQPDAGFLLVGSILLVAFSFPLKAVPGLMTAQERMYWIPFIQGIIPWFSLGIFALFLHHGWGLRAYVFGMAAAQVTTWIAFSSLVRSSPQKPRWDSKGITKTRLKSLLGFSMNLSGISLIHAAMNSLPALLIARAGSTGGLGVIPVYNFTTRGPLMVSNLVQRMNLAFYPRLQRLYVDGNRTEFKAKFKSVGILTVSFGVMAAGGVIIFTRMFVEILAGTGFYGGNGMTLWLAVGAVTLPLAALLQLLRQIAGSMGKALLFSAIKLAIAAALILPCYRTFGLSGLTAVVMLVPLIDAAYGYVKGATSCGFLSAELSRPIAIAGACALALILLVGSLIVVFPAYGTAFNFRNHTIHLPGWSEWASGATLILIGIVGALRQFNNLRKPVLPQTAPTRDRDPEHKVARSRTT